eukprot:gnl/MRDRNA2_/MRDRNA2_129183_c0_seq1.p1 gnl/MRDRNA2_/MRDRNA2_129183_c0~~gnl/MRDRNA2_/MRDRNA2_129183_c0_seq1.p1  ORF type:complete len:654 (-),score=124.74 gnl/MRDRNA2_/MRDRNA2_129183_c0_seq1:23-1984(-)
MLDTSEADKSWHNNDAPGTSKTPEQWDDSRALQMQISCVAKQTQSLFAVQTRSEVHMQALQSHLDMIAQQVHENQAAQHAALHSMGCQQEEIAQKLALTLSSIERAGRQKSRLGQIRPALVGRWHPCEAMVTAAKSLTNILSSSELEDLPCPTTEYSGTPKKTSGLDEERRSMEKKKRPKKIVVPMENEAESSTAIFDLVVGASASRLQVFVLLVTLASLISVSVWMFPRSDQASVDESPRLFNHSSSYAPVSGGASLRKGFVEVLQADPSTVPTGDEPGFVQPNPTQSETIQSDLIAPFLREIGFSSLNAKDAQGVTVLHTAIQLRRAAVAKLLLKQKEFRNVNAKDSQGWTVLHEAAVFGNADVGIALLETLRFTMVNGQDKSGRTALHLAAMKGHVGVAEVLLKHGPFTHVNEKDNAGRTALHYAAYFGHVDCFKALMNSSRFTELNAEDEKGATVLHYAAIAGYHEIAVAVMSDPRFTKINAKSHADRTALNHAARYGHMTIVNAILKHPHFTEWNGKDKQGYSVLHRAASHGHADVVEALLHLGTFVEVQTKDDDGWTALHHAAYNGHMDVVTVLLKSGRITDISEKNNRGKSALDLAEGNEHSVVASALRQHLLGRTSKSLLDEPASRHSDNPEEEALLKKRQEEEP